MPLPSRQQIAERRKTMLSAAASGGLERGFKEACWRRFLSELAKLVARRPELMRLVAAGLAIPLKLDWDFTDQGGELRYAKDGSFINDADHSEFDLDFRSIKILEAIYKRCARAPPAAHPSSRDSDWRAWLGGRLSRAL